jgi:hypothetical protein
MRRCRTQSSKVSESRGSVYPTGGGATPALDRAAEHRPSPPASISTPDGFGKTTL